MCTVHAPSIGQQYMWNCNRSQVWTIWWKVKCLRRCRLTGVLRLPRPSLATDTDIEREKCFPDDALLGLRLMESCSPLKLRSIASVAIPDWMDVGLRVVCILSQPEINGKEVSGLGFRAGYNEEYNRIRNSVVFIWNGRGFNYEAFKGIQGGVFRVKTVRSWLQRKRQYSYFKS